MQYFISGIDNSVLRKRWVNQKKEYKSLQFSDTCQFPPLFLTWASKIHFLVELPGFLFLSCLACNRTILLELPFRYHLAWKHILSPICKQRYILTLDSSIHPLFSNMVCCLTTLLVTTSTVNSHYPCCAGH